MIAMGMSPKVAESASTYVLILIPGVLTYCWQSCYIRFLSGQRITIVGMYANIIATLVHILLSILLTQHLDLGITGVAIASSVQFMVRFLVTIGYIQFSGRFDDPDHQVSLIKDKENFKNWGSQFILSL
jgi:Na+-driven multidrug efflux pump